VFVYAVREALKGRADANLGALSLQAAPPNRREQCGIGKEGRRRSSESPHHRRADNSIFQ
jgi:hypothetical protein